MKAGFFGLAVLCAAGSWLALRTYYGRYYSAMAAFGVMTPHEHIRRVDTALSYDPSHGYTNLLKARNELRSGRAEEALAAQEIGMKSLRSVRAYLQKATLLERLGRSAEAEKVYQHVISVAPGQVPAMERLAVIAYRKGDLERVEELARSIAEVDLNNYNPLYLNAIVAERRGQMPLAYQRYQRLSAAGKPAENALYDLEEIRQKLLQLKKVVGK